MGTDGVILITGGAGYIGSHLNKLLTARGYRTLVLDNLSTGHRDLVRWGEFVQGDIRDRAFLDRVFTEFPVSTVMHLAAGAYVHESVADPLTYFDNNVTGTLTLLQAMVAAGINRLVFSSSCATYGLPRSLPIGEDHPQEPVSPYGQSKLMAERIIAESCRAHHLRACALRYFNAAGADPEAEVGERHLPEPHLIPSLLEAACGRREGFSLHGADYPTPDGTCVRDFVHVMDIAGAHVLAMDWLELGSGEFAFNLGSGGGFSIKQVAAAVERIVGRPVRSRTVERRPGDPPMLVGDSARARDVLGWRPRYSDLETMIATAWRWHQRDLGRHDG